MAVRTHILFGSSFCGVTLYQYWSDLALWELFLNEYTDIRTIVEMGAGEGGFTLFLKVQSLARGLRFRSIDRNRPTVLDTEIARLLDIEKHFDKANFWESERLKSWVRNESFKPLLLFVDGGNKRREFRGFVPKLSSGDYVGVHDYNTEFMPEDIGPVEHLIEPVFEKETEGPPRPCLTRFWKVV